jgi:exopolysaccharide biosynthesis polyprenyl glycosylphosphotransferase
VVDEVIFVVSPARMTDLEDTFLLCEEQGVRTRVVLEYLPRQMARVHVEMVDGLPVMTFSTAPVDVTALAVKRAADVFLAALLLVLASPLLLAVALAVRLSSPGPVLFRQVRVGLNGRRFTLLKFRSMYLGAEERQAELAHLNVMDGPVFKARRDPRVTPVGRVLRAFSLDELPQLVNILRGDMSFVGPRPPIPEEVARYERWQRRRLSMKPGLTGLWQVSGRNEVDFETWMRMDLDYIDRWSLWLDLRIILRTIPSVLSRRGAM